MPTTTDTGFTLSQATIVGRQAVKIAVIAVVGLIVGRFLLTAAVRYYRAVNPPPPPPPTVGFGALPPLAFPDTNKSGEVTSYQLQLPGKLPNFGDRAKVFLLTQQSLGLLSDQRARQIAQQYNFVFAPEVLSSKTYRWTKSQPLQTTLEMDLSTYYFTLKSDFLSKPELLQGALPTEKEAVNRAKSFLSKAELLPKDTATASADVVYLKALGGEVQPAVSFSDADFIQVDITRTPIDGQYRMFTSEGYTGTVHAIVSKGLQNIESVVSFGYHHQEVDYSQVHTYPLRSSDSAWKLVQAGQGFVLNPGKGGAVVIRSINLGYFDSFTQQEYLQPIYVFEGDDGFMAYVSALDPTFIQNSNTGR